MPAVIGVIGRAAAGVRRWWQAVEISPLTYGVVLTLGVASFAWVLRASSFSIGFYQAVAQVIPVLLLVAVVHGGYFHGLSRRPRADRPMLRALFAIPLVAEGCALWALALGGDTLLLRAGVLAGLIVLLSLFIVFALEGPIRRRLWRSCESPEWSTPTVTGPITRYCDCCAPSRSRL